MTMATRPDDLFSRPATGLAIALAVALFAWPAAAAAQTAGVLFERAQAREATARAAATPSVEALRTAARSYENVVRRYPKSGFCDDALWLAGGLLRTAYEMSGARQDRTGAENYLEWLRKEYPHSALKKQVPAVLAALSDAPRPSPSAPPARTAPAAGVASLTSITQSALPQGDRITIELSREVAYTGDRVDGPDRVFFDFSQSAPESGLLERVSGVAGALVRELRVGRHEGNVTRVVLELAGSPRYSAFPLYDPFRLVIDVEADDLPVRRVESAIVEAPASAKAASTPGTAPGREGEERPAAASAPPPAPAASTARGDYTLARQLGLGISRVVIDAGHGGHDPGASANGVKEAELVLDVSLRLKRLLESHRGMEVVLTRDTDRFIALEERTAIANREGADLFLSIHANASRQTATNGIETYLLNFATNPSAEAVAARENATSAQTMGTLPTLLRSIMLNNKLKESRELATMVQTSLVRTLRTGNPDVRDLGIKQAPFVVLIGAQMPSVLAEISFLTNRAEAAYLKQDSYRQKIAQALADAVLKYQASLKKVTTIESQDESR